MPRKPVSCTVKNLPRNKILEAAQRAREINPVNAPHRSDDGCLARLFANTHANRRINLEVLARKRCSPDRRISR